MKTLLSHSQVWTLALVALALGIVASQNAAAAANRMFWVVPGSWMLAGTIGLFVNQPVPAAEIAARTKCASGNVDVVAIEGDKVVAKEGGIATIQAVVREGGGRLQTTVDVVVAPFYRDYHQTLVLKLFLGMEGQFVDRITQDPGYRKQPEVLCTFEEAKLTLSLGKDEAVSIVPTGISVIDPTKPHGGNEE